MPSFANRDLADLPLQLLDALVDLRLVQPELQRCHRSGLLRRRALETGQWRLVSSVVRHLDTCCGFPQKARTSLALCVAGSTAVAGLGWTARRPHSSSTFLSSVASSLCKRRILRTAWAGLLWMSFAAKRPSAGEGKEATPQRTLPGEGDFDTGDAPNPNRLPEISGAWPPSLWHPPLDLAHRFTPRNDGKLISPGFAPS